MKQKGENSKYPKTIETWKRGEPVPEWLSDRAKILGIDEKTRAGLLEFTPNTTGGYEIKDSSGQRALVSVKNPKDFVCFGDNNSIFALSPEQLTLLYTV
jgi:hypothetical protein